MKRLSLLALIFLCTTLAHSAMAADTPMAQVQSTIDQVLVVLKDSAGDKPSRIAETIKPRFDFEAMARLALRKHWKNQTEADRQTFIDLFSKMLEKTYITKISLYSAPEVQYVRERLKGNKAEVDTRIVVDSGAAIKVLYRLHLCKTEWKIYDVNVEGVSLIRNYRTQLASILKNNDFATLLTIIEKKLS